ncbi:MAG: hypothetical protein M1477_06855 [Candidatus Thermoplasmatota archaeon]|nr:hypothetical protein [Candidatus Thermoplasmatota archaeon]
MMSKSISMTIAVVVLLVFAGMTYFTIEKTSANVSLSEKGYLNVTLLDINGKQVNSSPESKMAPIYNSNDTITTELMVITNSTSIYLFDVSPLNNTTNTWTNTTEISMFDNATYNIIYANGSKTPVYYYPKLAVTSNYIRYNITNPNGLNETVYINLTLSVNQKGFNEMKQSSPYPEIYPYVVRIIGISSNGGGAGTGFAIIKF